MNFIRNHTILIGVVLGILVATLDVILLTSLLAEGWQYIRHILILNGVKGL